MAKPIKILLHRNFAPNSYDNSRKRGSGRSKVPVENKKVINVEYDKADLPEIQMLIESGHLKRVMREMGLGHLSFAMFTPNDNSPRKSRDKYRSILDGNAAANCCLAAITLPGVLNMSETVEIETAPSGWAFDEDRQEHVPIERSSVRMSLMDILLGLTVTTHGGAQKPLFNAISQDDNNDWDALFPGDKLRKEAGGQDCNAPSFLDYVPFGAPPQRYGRRRHGLSQRSLPQYPRATRSQLLLLG